MVQREKRESIDYWTLYYADAAIWWEWGYGGTDKKGTNKLIAVMWKLLCLYVDKMYENTME